MAQPEVMEVLEVHGPGIVEWTKVDNLGVAVSVIARIVADGEHGLAGVAVPTPKEIVLMAADGGRKAVLGSHNIYRACFAVVAAEDACVGANIGRQGVIPGRETLDHICPAEAVGENLRKRAGVFLAARTCGCEGRCVREVSFWRQDGQGDWAGEED